MKRSLPDRVVALVCLVSFVAGMFPRSARAQSETPETVEVRPTESPSEPLAPAGTAGDATAGAARPSNAASEIEREPRSVADPVWSHVLPPQGAPSTAPTPVPASVPNGVETTGVSSQVLSLPQGPGKIDGMGESFSNQLSTGTGSFSIPIATPGARGDADPSLDLSYSTSGGYGVAGVGWDIGAPFIARQTDRGSPRYQDPASGGAWAPTQDRFVFSGGQELVPICLVTGSSCVGAQQGEAMPAWASGWQYFRPRIEGSFLRFFWAPNHQTWRVQDKNGVSMELGAPLDGTSAIGTVEVNPNASNQIYRWNLSRQYDAYGAANPTAGVTPLPVNVSRFVYEVSGGTSYLTDVYDTPPAANAASAGVSAYAHHTRLLYAARPDVMISYRRGWETQQGLRLVGVDVTSAPFQGGASARKLVRRYHLAYDPAYHASMLASVQVEGRCGTPADGEAGEPVSEDANGNLPTTTGCPMLPAMTLGYTHVTPYHSDGSPGTADLAGFEGFDERVTTMGSSPQHSVDEEYTDLFDVNADGLPDVLVTMPWLYGGSHGVYFNGKSGGANAFTAGTVGVQGVLGDDATTISLSNTNVSSGDIDGDGVIDLINMPQAKTYSVYTPQAQGSGWIWAGRAITTAAAQSPEINFSGNGMNVQRMDVNGDGLVDVVVSTGTEIDTFFSLDRFPGGDGQFGYASWTGPTTATISNAPIASCVPWDGLPVSFSDGTIKLADMNGDGLPDIVRMQQGNVHYWPGQGNGYWGTGTAGGCPGGSFGESQSVPMASSPEFADPNGSALRIDDVNGDGLDDVVEVNFTEVNVWLNVDGTSWIGPHVIQNAPASPAYQSRVRTVDMNGSGTRDILWGDAGAYRFMDLSGGARPWLLTHVANGLGKTTDLAYASSTSLMVAAAAGGSPWSSVTPMPMTVVTQMTVRDNLPVAGSAAGQYVTQYTYANPVYDGLQREFRGFSTATARQVGDSNSPSSSSQSQFLLGTCEDDEPLGELPSACSFSGRWRDNPREALKGLPQSIQVFDDNASYESSTHDTYRLRRLYVGLDGREVRHAYASASDTYLYDVYSGDGAVSTVTTSDVELELTPPPFSVAEYLTLGSPVAPQQAGTLTLHGSASSTPGAGRVHLQTRTDVDVFGNTYHSIDKGCIEGCSPADDVITQYAQPSEVSVGSTGWLWRNTETTTLGSRDTEGRNTQQQGFDTSGSPLWTYRYLQGTLPLVRSNAGGGAVAPAPTTASKTGWIVALTQTYDPFGNALTSVAPNQRCTQTAFDSIYATLATSNTVDVGASTGTCGVTPLVATATYDRGLGAIKTMTDVHKSQTAVNYDGFGRLAEMFRPDPTTGLPGTIASLAVDYELPSDAQTTPYSIVHTEEQDGASPSVASYRESWAYVDGLGRTRVTFGQADPTAGDPAPWVATGLTTYDQKGGKNFTYLAFFYPADASVFQPSFVPTGSYARVQHDPFDRIAKAYALDGTLSLENHYHALSVDTLDAADEAGASHAGSFATSTKDGHGREVALTERNHVGGALQQYQTATTYLSTGETAVITRTNQTTGASVVRWMTYDTLGRMLVNVEPNTSVGFSPNPAANPAAIKSWRYAYDDNGELVGTSDARGCGANYSYDTGGRILGEDYSPCTADQAAYTPVSGTVGYEVSYLYDAPDPATSPGIPGFTTNTPWLLGRLASIVDRSGKTVDAYDGRGRATGIARQLVTPTGTLAPRWYLQSSSYDAADRVVIEQTAAVDSGATTPTVTSTVTTAFSVRSLVKSVESDHGAVIANVTHDADRLPLQIVYGDVARTTTTMSYTGRRQILSVQTYRGPPALWTSPPATYVPAPTYGGAPSTLQLLLEDLSYKYDEVDNPIEIDDNRSPAEWPAGAKPVTRTMQYDDLYRLVQINYRYASGTDPWTSPFAAEDQGLDPDPQRATPSPHVSFAARMTSQAFAFDWLGNTTSTGDDAGGFYDRSLGTITNGAATAGPYQLQSATNVGTAPNIASQGNLTVAYDAAGETTSMAVARSGACLPAGSICSQFYAYSWDEVGRLARARRWDLASPGTASSTLPTTTAAADLRYTYDATDDRAMKAATNAAGAVAYTLYPLDPLEIRQTTWDATAGDYDRTTSTQDAYIFSNGARLGRIATAEADEPSLTSGASHLFLELADHLGSTSTVIDQATGELVEKGTYQAFGGTESDYRPQRWNSFREDYRFTGKEEDVQVGLQYFGKRYFAPGLQRWVSPDPLALHVPGEADWNLYAYVHGQSLRLTDLHGLADEIPASATDVRIYAHPNPDGSTEASYVPNGKSDIQYEFVTLRGDTSWKDIAKGTVKFLWNSVIDVTAELAYSDPRDPLEGYRKEPNNDDQRVGSAVVGPALVLLAPEVIPSAPLVSAEAAVGSEVAEGSSAASTASREASAACSGGTCSCFVAGTLVDTVTGAKEIERVALGDLAGPESDTCASLSLGGWSEVDLKMQAAGASNGDIEIELLRPPSWLTEERVEIGRDIPLSLDEWGIHGDATVTKVVRGPDVGPSTRCPVTGLIRHLSDQVVSVRTEGATYPLGVTQHHRLFSADRAMWVEAGTLHEGEALRTKRGTTRVLDVRWEAGAPVEVFNLEVTGDHAYFVGEHEVLAHNECVGPRWTRSKTVKDQGAIFKRQGGDCNGCGIEMTKEAGPRQMHLDHPDNFSEHGPIDPLKAQGLCRTCNLLKGSMDLKEWVQFVRDWVWTTKKAP